MYGSSMYNLCVPPHLLLLTFTLIVYLLVYLYTYVYIFFSLNVSGHYYYMEVDFLY